MGGPLSTPELISPRISAANINVTGTLTIANFSITNASFSGTVSAGSINAAGNIFGGSLTTTGDVSANTGTVFASAVRGSFLVVSAAGTTQATGASLTAQMSRLKGVVDGTTTGFVILANRIGWQQTVYNDSVSANLWPCVGGAINALTSNAAFAMAANTQYIISHIGASAYAVK